ncbi:hypothetical protein D0X99_09790 [Algoriphagus lacus]|uniref:Transmembrane protein n=1 Tax=Algoriphagus lacus TaxID=2056311 RepID=A0A418PS58_9BACT|nr:hypothetical protein D0X99_09790 [Algoriphagus lacus]
MVEVQNEIAPLQPGIPNFRFQKTPISYFLLSHQYSKLLKNQLNLEVCQKTLLSLLYFATKILKLKLIFMNIILYFNFFQNFILIIISFILVFNGLCGRHRKNGLSFQRTCII